MRDETIGNGAPGAAHARPAADAQDPQTLPLSRRDVLRIGAMSAAAAACRGPISAGGPPEGVVDHARAARKAYEDSLAALRRTVVTPTGKEISQAGTGRLSLGPEALRPHRGSRPGQPDFDVLIIGSGYGGAVCAARLAAHRRPGVKIGVLERGREWVPGTFPSSLANFQPFSKRSSWLREQLVYNPLGLFGFHNQGDVTVVGASGLGGASLINCAVVIETDEAVFRQPAWPEELSSKSRLRPYYDRAWRTLAPQRTPEDRFPPKLKAHLGAAEVLMRRGVWQTEAYPLPLAVTFSDRTNAQGIRQHGCVQCGDCSTGCNVGAKHSLDMNYLPMAWAAGALIFSRVEVDRVEKAADTYRLHCILRSDRFGEEREVVTARVVIMTAGVIGTNEILLRSRDAGGLAISEWLGKGFSGNGNHVWLVDYQHAARRTYRRHQHRRRGCGCGNTDEAGRAHHPGHRRFPSRRPATSSAGRLRGSRAPERARSRSGRAGAGRSQPGDHVARVRPRFRRRRDPPAKRRGVHSLAWLQLRGLSGRDGLPHGPVRHGVRRPCPAVLAGEQHHCPPTWRLPHGTHGDRRCRESPGRGLRRRPWE